MALSSSKPLSLLIIVLLFTFSQITQARDSQFFSKVSSVKNDNDHKKTTPTTTTTEVNPDTNNKDDEVEGFEKEEDPTFTNDSQNEGYGLYGHESGQNPPFAEEKHFTTTRTTTNSPVANYNDNFGKQGMSDTRFMANGKYFYDVSSEKSTTGYNPESFSTTSYDEKNYDPNSYRNDEDSNENDNKAVDYTNPKNWYSNRERNNRRYGQNSLTDNNNNNNKAVDYSNPRNRYNNDNNRGNDNRFYGSNNVNDNKHYNSKDVDYTNPKNWYNNRANDNSFYGDNKSNDNENYYNNNNNKYYGSSNNDEKNDNSFEGYQNEGQTFQENQEFVP